LKLVISIRLWIVVLSRPSRARGLKLDSPDVALVHKRSRPSRARGLKRELTSQVPSAANVAPFTGAWIETSDWGSVRYGNMSRPSRARGLKHRADGEKVTSIVVAPFTGAWIETRSLGDVTISYSRRALHGRVD